MHTAIVVHESWLMREIIKTELAECDCRVACNVSHRLEAVLAYRLYRPDVVLIDAMKSRREAYALIDDLRSFDADANIIVMVGPNDDVEALHALMSGAKGFWSISSTSHLLMREIQRILPKQSAMRPIQKSVEKRVKRLLVSMRQLPLPWLDTRRISVAISSIVNVLTK